MNHNAENNMKRLTPKFLHPILYELKKTLGTNSIIRNLDDQIEDLRVQWKTIIERRRSYESNMPKRKDKRRVLILTGYGLGTSFATVEAIIGYALKLRGCEVLSLFCNAALPACEFNEVGNDEPRAIYSRKQGIRKKTVCSTCYRCKNNVESLHSILEINAHGLDRYINDADYGIAERIASTATYQNVKGLEYEKVNIGEHIYSSILRVTLRGEISDTAEGLYLIKRYTFSAVLMTNAYKKAFLAMKVDRLVCIHGIYLTHGIAVNVARNLNIPVVVLGGGGIRKDTVLACHGETYHKQLINESNDTWINRVVSEKERTDVVSYAFKKRYSGSSVDYLSYHPNPIDDLQYIYRKCNIDATRPIITAYTNVIWDAQILYKSNAFTDIFHWLKRTIELAEDLNIWLLIRVHPAEAKGGLHLTKQPIIPELLKLFPVLPSNVKIIPPESNISSYALAEISVANIVYGTKMALEMALMKRKVILCGETFSRNKGFAIDIDSLEQYDSVLKNSLTSEWNTEQSFDLAVRYAHYLYFRKMIDLPISSAFESRGKSTIRLTLNDYMNLDPNCDDGIRILCDGILEGAPLCRQ